MMDIYETTKTTLYLDALQNSREIQCSLSQSFDLLIVDHSSSTTELCPQI